MPFSLVTILLAAALIAAVIALVFLWQRWRASVEDATTKTVALSAARTKAAAEVAKLKEGILTLEGAVARLRKFEGVANADEQAVILVRDTQAKVAALLQEAEASAKTLQFNATRLHLDAQAHATDAVAKAEEEARTIRAEAGERAKASAAQAEAILADARGRADAVIADAQAKAQALAGDALKALQDARELERAVQAMKNTIEGYGDRYLIPSQTLVDDLAEELAHTDVGQKLKIIREQIRQAMKLGRAATCDYVEENRRETAIRFVVDAFNGKADSALAKVKQDNAGTLQQEIKDGFALVNLNGKAFRDARITEEYLNLRLEELRWAAAAHEIKNQEREEQRRIKEQIREEEKARKEYERAIREAARDEELVRRAMDKAQEQLAKASEDQKAKYEGQLQALQEKLKEAEEKNQRALSMAQQTKRGHVYIISNVGSFGEHVYKIGLTRRLEPLDRIRELGDSSVPFEFDVHALIFAEDAPRLEYELHRHFMMMQVNKVNYRKEFFRVDLAHVREEIGKLGLSAKWTMAATAMEYRESMKIEELISKDPAAREAWVRRQLTYEPAPNGAEDENDPLGSHGAETGALAPSMAPAPAPAPAP